MLALDRVSKTYPNGVQALLRFSADIRLGEIIAIIGGSGCGKSTAAARHRRPRSRQRWHGDARQ
ncbi:ABC-type phosphate/phosphonate transport system ATPase subunit [Bradyrhizobium ottawaense]